MKKNICFLIFFILIFIYSNHSVLAEETISIDSSIGINGYSKLDSELPVDLTIEYNGEDMEGEIQLHVTNTYNSTKKYIISEPISLSSDTTKKIHMTIPTGIDDGSNKIGVYLISKDKTIYNTEIFNSSTNTFDSDSLFYAIFTDDEEQLQYMNTYLNSIIPANTKSRTFFFGSNSIPETKDVYDCLDLIVINNINTSSLNKNQYSLLKEFVTKGGTVLIGTGTTYNKTLSLFNDDFLEGTLGSLAQTSTTALNKSINTAGELNLSLININIMNSQILVGDKDLPIVQSKKIGKGNIIVYSFDLGLSPFKDWTFATDFLKYTTPIEFTNLKSKNIRYHNHNNTYFLDINPNITPPNFWIMVLVFSIYTFIIGPITYLLLKIKDKREYMWFFVPITSILFVFIFFITGFNTNVKNNTVNLVNIIEQTYDHNYISTSYGSLVSPNKKDLTIETPSRIKILPIISRDYNSSNNKDIILAAKYMGGLTPSLTFYNNPLFALNKFKVLQDIQLPNGSVITDLNYKSTSYLGTIKNTFEFELKDCFLLIDDKLIEIGNIKPEESIEMPSFTKSYNNDIYEILDQMFPYDYNKPMKNLENRKENRQRRSLLDKYLREKTSLDEPLLICFTDKPLTDKIIINNKAANQSELSLISIPIEVNYTKGASINTKIVSPVINKIGGSANFEYSYDTINSTGTYEFVYKLPLDTIEIDSVNISFNHNTNSYYIWDYSSSNWVILKLEDIPIKKQNLIKYANKSLPLKLKVTFEDTDNEIPVLTYNGKIGTGDGSLSQIGGK